VVEKNVKSGLQISVPIGAGADYVMAISRAIHATNTGIQFDTCKAVYTGDDNYNKYDTADDLNIPYKIYGIKDASATILTKLEATPFEGVMSRKLLWENPDPTVAFDPKSVGLDLTEYDEVEIEYSVPSNDITKKERFAVGRVGQLVLFTHLNNASDTEPPYIFNRDIVVMTNGIEFANCILRLTNNATYASLQNNYCKPLRIYGIKDISGNLLTRLDTTPFEGVISKKLVWTNPSPSANLDTQNIPLDLSEYDEVEVEYRPFNNYSQTKRASFKIGTGAVLDMVMSNSGLTEGSTVFAGFRLVSATTSTVKIDTGYSYVDPDNRLCVPVKIYGIKEVSGDIAKIVVDEAEKKSGLAAYVADGIDPDTTTEPLILTNMNTPLGDGYFMYISTVFYNEKSSTANRAQTAIPYKNIGSMYHRYYFDGEWSEWRRHVNADELDKYADYIVSRGASGNWTYEKWNSGYCRAQFRTGLQGVAITTAYGTMYRSQAYSYSFPSGLFTTVKTADVQVRGDGIFAAITDLTTTKVSAHMLSPFSHTYATTATYNFWAITVEGSWK
jgi:hypothetical protein